MNQRKMLRLPVYGFSSIYDCNTQIKCKQFSLLCIVHCLMSLRYLLFEGQMYEKKAAETNFSLLFYLILYKYVARKANELP